MTEQLSLFKVSDSFTGERFEADPMLEDGNLGALDELFRFSRRWSRSRNYMELLEFISRFPAYSPLNCFLIHLQDPAATQVATARTWQRKYQRRVKPGSRPRVILAPMSPVLFVFDIRDTEGPDLPVSAMKPPSALDRLPSKTYEAAMYNCAIQHIAVREIAGSNDTVERSLRVTPAIRKRHPELGLEPHTRYLIRLDNGLSLEEKFAALVLELGHLFCGHLGIDGAAWWPDRKIQDLERIDIEAASTAHLVCFRQGLTKSGGRFLAECRNEDRALPLISLSVVFQAVAHIEAMLRAFWTKPRRQGRH